MADYVRSVVRSLRILKYLSEEGSVRNLSSIAVAAELPTSTTHRLLTTMETEKFVRFDASQVEWQVGVGAFSVGSKFGQGRDLILLSKKYLQRLSTITGETSNIYIESNGVMVCLSQVESKHNIRAITKVGGVINIHCSAAGKAVMAYRARSEVKAILKVHGMKKLTENTITEVNQFLSSLDEVARKGFSSDLEENLEGLSCISAPIFNEYGRSVYAVSVSGPSTRFKEINFSRVSASLLSIANEITNEFGGTKLGFEII
jgi:IclR family acetate operon transcriptional repressor